MNCILLYHQHLYNCYNCVINTLRNNTVLSYSMTKQHKPLLLWQISSCHGSRLLFTTELWESLTAWRRCFFFNYKRKLRGILCHECIFSIKYPYFKSRHESQGCIWKWEHKWNLFRAPVKLSDWCQILCEIPVPWEV